MNCPRCRIPMLIESFKDLHYTLELDHCAKCGGTWFDKGELSKLDRIMEPVILEIRKIPSKKDQLVALSCPSCDDLLHLQKAEHPRDQKVILDFCPSCKGIWLDKGEIEAIQKEHMLTTVGKFFKFLILGE